MTQLPGMSLLCVLIAAVFAFSSVVPTEVSSAPVAAAIKKATKKKSKRSRKRSRRTACTPASRAAGKKQAYALLSTQSPELCRLTGVQYASNRDTIINTADILASDGELALDQQGADQPYEEGEIIAELEPTDRGLFGGVVGYFDFEGNADLAIAIRTAVIRDGAAHVQAGAGIVLDSVPESEYQETKSKAAAVLRAIAAAKAMKLG